jgi:hypothetical protein
MNDPGESILDDIACRGRGFCVAVGSYTDADSTYGLIETLSGGRWTATKAPLPTKVETTSVASLAAVACPAVGSCEAVGSYFTPHPSAMGLMETLSKGTWTASRAPSPADASSAPDVFLKTVTCPAVGSCVAVGSYDDRGGNIPELIETLSHGTWRPTELPRAAVVAVTCPAAGTCVAVGSSYGKRGRPSGLIETLSRGRWTTTQAPLPPNAAANRSPSLDAVTCAEVGSCLAVGAYTDKGLGHDGLVEALTRRSWTPKTSSPRPGTDARQAALSCRTAVSCVAVGSYLDADGVALHGLVETLSGHTWTTSKPPLPANAGGENPVSALNDITCQPLGSCVAVGWYTDANGHVQGLIEMSSADDR